MQQVQPEAAQLGQLEISELQEAQVQLESKVSKEKTELPVQLVKLGLLVKLVQLAHKALQVYLQDKAELVLVA